MAPLQRLSISISALLATGLLAGCGGGGGGAVTPTTPVVVVEAGAPVLTGDTATDGYNWFNFRRKQMGLSQLTRSTALDGVTQGHSNYMRLNTAKPDASLHNQTSGNPGFTGVDLKARLTAASYDVPQQGYFASEVIAAASTPAGEVLAEELVTAIYHRFAVFEPALKEAGAGARMTSSGLTYFTTNFGARGGIGPGVGTGKIASYPFAGQINVQTFFLSDTEAPDPIPDKNEVGYPISVHADYNTPIVVSSFTLNPRGGAKLEVKYIAPDSDYTPVSAAAIVPMSRLSAKTVYDVSFSGTVGGAQVTQNWSFTTR
ncbi:MULTISPECIES: CAP domain-containing protein [unclassified Janthinobacterium]|uniref:CAP domain-containing protein n=1 Tax=unclassified Janthinobacterium TaxID=2610881 RepID=UPI0004761848|nr:MULTISPECIES: CAP domain-containing protein [unclassified Janthinobacterium]MEC5163471.1 uncharacterized protein YkwD [Janthinobacterium sp. CG_S6]